MFIKPDFRLTRRIPFNLICAVLIFVAASQSAAADEAVTRDVLFGEQKGEREERRA